jgi:hypothetical protein
MFAREPIMEGEVLVVWGGILLRQDAIDAGQFKPHTVAAVGDGIYLAGAPEDEEEAADFTNHSCDPNLWMGDEVTIAARRNIQAGEELTADYAMWEGDERWVAKWQCRCGTSHCRQIITGRDWRLSELQERYKGHFSPFINQRIASSPEMKPDICCPRVST